MKLNIVIKAPGWSAKEADLFVDLFQDMLDDYSPEMLGTSAFMTTYKVKNPKKKTKRKKAKRLVLW